MRPHTLFLTYWAELGSIGGSFNSLEPIVDYGVAIRVESSIFVVSSFEFATTSSEYGGDLSFLTLLLIIKLADTRTSSSLL
jgi:hypothetical protein